MSTATDEADLQAVRTEGLAERICRGYGWLVIAVATTVAYSNTFMAPFVFDGTNYIVDNADLRDLNQPLRILRFSPTRAVGYYSFALNYALSKRLSATDDGYDPRSWHAVNLAIHILAAWTLWGLARRALQSSKLGGRYAAVSEQLALAMALVWAVHPLCTQAVTYLYQRVESLMGLLLLLTIYCTARFAECRERLEAARPDPWDDGAAGSRMSMPRPQSVSDTVVPSRFYFGLFFWPTLAVFCCLIGMATKETMLVAPIVAIWYDRVFLARSWYELVCRRGLQYLAMFTTWILLWYLMRITPYDAAGINDHRHDTPLTYFLNETRVILHYFKLVFVPWGQNLDYAWQRAVIIPEYVRPDEQYVRDTFTATKGSLAALVAIGLATLIAVFRRPALGFLGSAVFITLAPTSSFVVIIDLCFEHRMYVPLMAMVPLVVVLAYEAVGLLGRLLDLAIDVHCRSFGRERGRFGVGDETVSCLRVSLAWLTVAVLIALTLHRNRDYESHVAIWADAFAKAPHNARAAYNHGVFLQNEGRMEEAIAQYRETLQRKADYDGAHLNLANVFAWQATTPTGADRRAELLGLAEHHYRELLRYLPGDERGLYGLADVLRQARRWQEAEPYVDQLLSINPQHEPGQKLKDDIRRELPRPSASPTPTDG